MALRTYGDKPISFQIEEGGDFYCVGSEVFTIYVVFFTVHFEIPLSEYSSSTCFKARYLLN